MLFDVREYSCHLCNSIDILDYVNTIMVNFAPWFFGLAMIPWLLSSGNYAFVLLASIYTHPHFNNLLLQGCF